MLDPVKLKKDFPIFTRQINGHPLVYLDSAATTQKPKPVIDAIVNYYRHHNANVARGVHTLAEESTRIYEESRQAIAGFINAAPEEVIFVRNSTEALNLVAFSWGVSKLAPGDVIITSLLEHHSNILPWRLVAEKTGAKLKFIDVDDKGRLKVTNLEELLDSQVKIVAFSAKSNMTGAIQPINVAVKSIRQKSADAVIVLDGSHSVPHLATDVKKLGVDFLSFSGHKLLGPMGIGVLWGKKQRLEAMEPFMRGGEMVSEVTLKGQKWNKVPHKFEAGTPNVAGAVGLAAAVKYLQKVGLDQIYQHEVRLTNYALNLLQSLKKPKISLIGPAQAAERSGVIAFNVEGVHAHDVARILDSEGIAVRSGQHCTGPLMERLNIPASVRVSFYLYNTKEEVDRLAKALVLVPNVFKL